MRFRPGFGQLGRKAVGVYETLTLPQSKGVNKNKR